MNPHFLTGHKAMVAGTARFVPISFLGCVLFIGSLLISHGQPASPALDSLAFGDAASEPAHGLTADHSQIITGGLGDPARILLPLTEGAWEGGQLDFTLKVDPASQNYATVRLWGSDATENQLVLFCEGKQVGYRHLGDIEILDIGGGEAPFPGRFTYRTSPLPLQMTKGKTELHFQIRSYGPTWGYASGFDKFQKSLVGPTRGIYQLYIHTNDCFIPPASEKQGAVPAPPPVRTEPGAEVLDKLKARVNREIDNELKSTRPLNEMQVQFLARAYAVKWTAAYQNEKVVAQVLKGLDGLFAAYRENPALAHNDPATPNPEWFEFGPAGDAINLLAGPLNPFLNQMIGSGNGEISRRAAYSEMLQVSRDWHLRHRRLYSNQTMIADMNIYLCNRGLQVVDPANALPEARIRHYLYEAVGLEPWSDSEPGPDSHRWGVGTNYWELTAKGLTKELGFVGYYGEVLDWVTSIYNATRPVPGQPGDEKIKAQLEKIAGARVPFRAPGVDSDGFRAMRAETIVGWRDNDHYPGNVLYAERPTWDASAIYEVAATLDPKGIGYVQQMFEDGQFFISLERQMAQSSNLRVTAGLLEVPDDFDLIKSQPPNPARLPMTAGQPDFVFSDEEDGVLAVKNGNETFYASLYWRSRNAVNSLARIHWTTPTMDHIAVVQEQVQFEPDGRYYARPDHTTFGFANGGPRYPEDLHSAEAGEKLPIARVPADVQFQPGEENVYAGKGEFYQLRYGNYLVGMNMTPDQTFQLQPPAGLTQAKELVSGKQVKLDGPVKVAPRTTIVLFLGTD